MPPIAKVRVFCLNRLAHLATREGSMSTKPLGPTFSALALAAIVSAAASPSFAADKTIKIGALLPMSGPGSYFGAQDKQGIELALEALNQAGLGGYKLDVRYE